ncbi:hypothetical protein M1446_04165 [Candidatus Dependentiae bacterium]|nr:hypothetical protein [Candidatus Dependentiae bacterium]
MKISKLIFASMFAANLFAAQEDVALHIDQEIAIARENLQKIREKYADKLKQMYESLPFYKKAELGLQLLAAKAEADYYLAKIKKLSDDAKALISNLSAEAQTKFASARREIENLKSKALNLKNNFESAIAESKKKE